MWAGDSSNIPDGYLLCDGQWIENTGDYTNLYQKLNGLYDTLPDNAHQPNSGQWHRLPSMCNRYPLGTENWSTVNQGNVYGGSKKLDGSKFVHKHWFDRNGFVHSQHETSCWTGNGNHIRGKSNSHKSRFYTKGVEGSDDNVYITWEDSNDPRGEGSFKKNTNISTNDDFLPKYSVLKYIIRYK